MNKRGHFFLSLLAVLIGSFAVTAFLTKGSNTSALLIGTLFALVYNYLVPLAVAHLASTPVKIAGLFAALAAIWAVVRSLQTSFTTYRAAGFTLIQDGNPTLYYYLFEGCTIVLIAALIIAFGTKYGQH